MDASEVSERPLTGPRRRWFGTAARITLGCLVVVIVSAAVSALLVRHEVSTLQSALGANPSLDLNPGVLAPAGWGDPQTLLLVGNDQRKHTTTTPVLPHSNEMLLVRIDPSKPWISMMSIPRELWVPIQTPNGVVTTRLNYAYTAGGIPLLVSTIKRDIGLSINHVIVIDFNQFQRAVDAVGCVYSTVDRRYYHVNTPGSQQYQEVDLQPGYQKLCGPQALQFVSYRHGDTSLVRDARDQSFLLDVKKQYGPTLVGNIHKFERIFGESVRTDAGLHSQTGILDLLGTLISSASLRVRQVQFQVNLFSTYDTASPAQIAASVHSFLHGADRIPSRSTAVVAHAVHNHKVTARLPLVASAASELADARAAGTGFPFPLEYPRVRDAAAPTGPLDLNGCSQDGVTCMRTYLIHDARGVAYPAYAIVESAGQLGQFYDVQGTTWTGAPQFSFPDQAVTVGGRTYDLYYAGSHLKMVAWFEHGAVYWIHNTLLDAVGNGEMLAIAEQTTPITSGAGVAAQRHATVSLRPAIVPTRTRASRNVSTRQTLGVIGAVVTLLVLPALSVVLIRRRRQLRRVRRELARAEEREERLFAAIERLRAPPPTTEAAAPQPRPDGRAGRADPRIPETLPSR